MRRQRRRAFTLMELMLTMAIMVMVAAVSYPSLDALYAGVKVDAAGDAVRAAWSQAEAHAINEGRPYRFAVMPGTGKYRVAPDSDAYWSGGGDTPASDDPDNPPMVLEDSLPEGINFALGNAGAGADGSGYAGTAVFLPDGSARDDVEINVGTGDAPGLTLRLRGLTGVVTVQRGGE
jgi:prepilin-type N-terminal cleavage/methylation domain-containing protein